MRWLGLSAGGRMVTALFYAVDAVLLAEWCKEWGVEVKCGEEWGDAYQEERH